MTAPLDLAAIRDEHVEMTVPGIHGGVDNTVCRADRESWPCDAALLAAALEAAQADNERLRKALNVQPETLPEPIGRIRKRWWRLGWLSAQAVARDALAADRATGAEAERPTHEQWAELFPGTEPLEAVRERIGRIPTKPYRATVEGIPEPYVPLAAVLQALATGAEAKT